jgi:hypothetical protein
MVLSLDQMYVYYVISNASPAPKIQPTAPPARMRPTKGSYLTSLALIHALLALFLIRRLNPVPRASRIVRAAATPQPVILVRRHIIGIMEFATHPVLMERMRMA